MAYRALFPDSSEERFQRLKALSEKLGMSPKDRELARIKDQTDFKQVFGPVSRSEWIELHQLKDEMYEDPEWMKEHDDLQGTNIWVIVKAYAIVKWSSGNVNLH